MARVSTYLNFNRDTEAAFVFYQSVFGTEFAGPIARFGDGPGCEGQPPLAEPDMRAETERLFAALSAGGAVEMPLQEMFWGGYFASVTDRFGIRWMLNCDHKT